MERIQKAYCSSKQLIKGMTNGYRYSFDFAGFSERSWQYSGGLFCQNVIPCQPDSCVSHQIVFAGAGGLRLLLFPPDVLCRISFSYVHKMVRAKQNCILLVLHNFNHTGRG